MTFKSETFDLYACALRIKFLQQLAEQQAKNARRQMIEHFDRERTEAVSAPTASGTAQAPDDQGGFTPA